MSDKRDFCSALDATAGRCRNGFPVTAPCYGISADVVRPYCLNEKWCALTYEQWGGKPPPHLVTTQPESNRR